MFRDRRDAGEKLATELNRFKVQRPIVLAIPRGGVVVGWQVATELGIELDVTVPRKMESPLDPELAIGAATSEGLVVLNDDVVSMLNIKEDYVRAETERQVREARRRLKKFRGNKPPQELSGKTVIIIDDGMATGATMKAAVLSAKAAGSSKVVVGVPVASQEAVEMIGEVADEVVALETPLDFSSVGQFYDDFRPISDEEVSSLLGTP